MNLPNSREFSRRQFIQQIASATGVCLAAPLLSARSRSAVTIVLDPADAVAASAPSQWAAKELQRVLTGKEMDTRIVQNIDQAETGSLSIVAAGSTSSPARQVLGAANASVPAAAEALALAQGTLSGKPVLLAAGSDARGLVYALLELADRVQYGDDPLKALRYPKPVVERPANRIRCMSRAFSSDVEDKPWYNDRDMWPRYLAMLMTNRFNRFNLTLGLAYDFTRNVSDCYFHFAYPFLLAVPGYDVRAVGLPDSERDHNLKMLRFMSDQAAACGIEFQLGVWTHAYVWTNSPKANYTIAGLTPDLHGPYCRDALKMVLEMCPGITGVTIRIHGESGVPEGSYEFWQTVFDGVAQCGRKVEIDLHAKGIDEKMINQALATGMPVVAAPKYWAEHMGLPYHQAAIRELEMVPKGAKDQGFFALSSGSRRFMRYGYGDLLREDRRYGILYRMFPGARRVMLWGDPLTAAGYGRISHFCGTDGVDFMEPLYFKGRRGSGVPGGRCSYADASLNPHWDWEKFLYTYRVWGRHLYNPEAEPDTWRRFTNRHFGKAAPAAENALANATRVLQTVCTAHGVSAAHNSYWPEMYWNMSIVDPQAYSPYGDTPAPKRFGTVSPFDPQLFLTIDQTAEELLQGEWSGKYTQVEAAQWLEDLAEAAMKHLKDAQKRIGAANQVEFRRWVVDTTIQAGLGRFFAAKFRSGILWAIHDHTGDRTALEQALLQYRKARAAWVELADCARDVYMENVSYGQEKFLSGHWLDRIPAIDEDIARMEKLLGATSGDALKPGADSQKIRQAVQEALGRIERPSIHCRHVPARTFSPGQPLGIELNVEKAGPAKRPVTVRLFYRHVDQSERYETVEMAAAGNRFNAVIPSDYTNSPFPLQYYFEVRTGPKAVWLHPGLGNDRSGQPYFVVRQSESGTGV